MIRLMLGNVGSGKTATMVRELVQHMDGLTSYSNIKTPKLKHNISITKDMIITTDVEEKNGKEKEIKVLNKEFWEKEREVHDCLNVIIDEAHIMFNARNAMKKENKIAGDFLALIRRIVGAGEDTGGEFILITQLFRRLDVWVREMANLIQYHICHYLKHCTRCNYTVEENNETPDKLKVCPHCGNNRFKKSRHIIEVLKFNSSDAFEQWFYNKIESYYDRYFINDISQYFGYYNTLQWDNLFS